jgi:hypothetical protein
MATVLLAGSVGRRKGLGMVARADKGYLEVVPYDECITFLAKEVVGRLAWVRHGSPVVVPVNYAWDGEAVVIRIDPSAKLHDLTQGEVAFEIDAIDREQHTGWSVLVVGMADEVDPKQWPASATHPDALELRPWPAGPKDRWLRLVPRAVTGRRLGPSTPATASGFGGTTENQYWRLSPST